MSLIFSPQYTFPGCLQMAILPACALLLVVIFSCTSCKVFLKNSFIYIWWKPFKYSIFATQRLAKHSNPLGKVDGLASSSERNGGYEDPISLDIMPRYPSRRPYTVYLLSKLCSGFVIRCRVHFDQQVLMIYTRYHQTRRKCDPP